MTVFRDIDAALSAHLNTMVGKPPVAWENSDYEPTLGTLYVRAYNLFGDTAQSTLGESGEDMTIGIFQLDVFAESGKGKKAAMDMADLLADRFKRGTDLTYNSRVVTVTRVQRRTANNSGGWYQIPVEVVYRAQTAARV